MRVNSHETFSFYLSVFSYRLYWRDTMNSINYVKQSSARRMMAEKYDQTCQVTGKRKYSCKSDARGYSANRSKRVRVYKCIHCTSLHVTVHSTTEQKAFLAKPDKYRVDSDSVVLRKHKNKIYDLSE